MEQNAQFAPTPQPFSAAAPAPVASPLSVLPVFAHLCMFAALAWQFSRVPAFAVVFDDLGTDLPVPTAAVVNLSHFFESAGIPLWTLVFVLFAVDCAVCWLLYRRRAFVAMHRWMWAVAACVIPASVLTQQVLLAPLLNLIESMK